MEEELEEAETRETKLNKQVSEAETEHELTKRMHNELYARGKLERPKLERMDSQFKEITALSQACEERLKEVKNASQIS